MLLKDLWRRLKPPPVVTCVSKHEVESAVGKICVAIPWGRVGGETVSGQRDSLAQRGSVTPRQYWRAMIEEEQEFFRQSIISRLDTLSSPRRFHARVPVSFKQHSAAREAHLTRSRVHSASGETVSERTQLKYFRTVAELSSEY